ncbi:hypothetical protein [Caldanaerobius polysaccharolyticus]|uniref:hypothetical protein n=1 Tax=Caldanaerobius polysaccharolyticus TaxID=44256 RepID=UPI00047E620C|nr:hypothetical protein [Caldanaerobius polysaccharolyticus]
MVNILQQLAIDKNLAVSTQEITDWYNSLNLMDIENTIRQWIRVELWDGVSPVNGVPAETIKNSDGFPKDPNAKGYFVYIDNNLVYFQYHTLSGMNAITDANFAEECNKHVNQIVEQLKQQQITQMFLSAFADRTQANTVSQQQLDMMTALADIATKLGVI